MAEFKRVKPREYDWVSFTVPEIYGDAEFVLPSMSRMPLYIANASPADGLGMIVRWLVGAEVPKKMAQAVVDLDLEEFKIFQMAWQSASQVTLPKSGKSSSSTRKKRKQSKRR